MSRTAQNERSERRGASKARRAWPFVYLYTTARWFRRAGRRERTRCMTCPGVRRTAVFACGRSGASRSGSGFKVAEDLIPVHPSARGRRGPDAEKECLHNEGTLIFNSVDRRLKEELYAGCPHERDSGLASNSWHRKKSFDCTARRSRTSDRLPGFSAGRFVAKTRFIVGRRPAAHEQQTGKLLIMMRLGD